MAALAYPAFVGTLYFSRPNVVAAFKKAGAFTAQTSRRPDSLKVGRIPTGKAAKKGLLIPVGDGRFYIDRAALRRADRKKWVVLALLLLPFLPFLWLIW